MVKTNCFVKLNSKFFMYFHTQRTSLQQLLTHKSGISDLLESDVNDFDDHNDVPLQQLVYYLLCGKLLSLKLKMAKV